MDTGDPIQDDVPKKTGPKGKKKKEKKISLDEFLSKDVGPVNPPPKSNSWAIMAENPEDEYENNFKFDRSTLPTAPKAAMGPAVDLSQISNTGPFSAYIGNLSYDASEDDLYRFFSQLEIDTVRIITDGGRPRGYAYVDFLTKDSLVEALSYNEKEYMGRTIRVDLATDKNHDSRGGIGAGGRSNEPDRTDSDWRRREPVEAPAPSKTYGSRDETDRGGRYGDRDRGYGFGGDRDRDRRGFGDRDFGGDRDRGSFGGDRDRDRGSFGGDRDRDRGSFGGDRDRGFGGRDRGFGGDRDRDRGFGSGGERDRGFGDRNRDSGFGGGRDRDFGDRDRGGRFGGSSRSGGYERRDDYGRQNRQDDFDRRPSSRDGSRDRDRGFGGDRDRGNRYEPPRDNRRDDFGRGNRQDNDRRPQSREGSQERRSADGPKVRPVLKLQPRSKPVEKENQPDAAQKSASIFGSAKPVDTYAKEKEIEEKIRKKEGDREDFKRKEYEPKRQESESWRQESEPRRQESEPRRQESEPRRQENESRRQTDDGSDRRRRSSSSGVSELTKSVLPVQKPHVPSSRREGVNSRVSEGDSISSDGPLSPSSPKSADVQQPKMVPAPPPKENAWGRKREPTSPSPTQDSSNNYSSAKRDDLQKMITSNPSL